MKLQDRTFIISGGSSGLGLATAAALLSQGANVSLLDLNPPPSGISLLLTNPSRTLYTRTDVTSTASLQHAIDSTVSWISSYANAPLGGVICCAGIGYGERALPRQDPGSGKVKTMSIEGFDRVIAINLRGTVDLIRLALPHLAAVEGEGDDGERGVIVVVSSVAAYEGQIGQLAYSASKGAVAGIVLPLAREVGRTAGIRVVGVAPGVFQTGMTVRPRNSPPGESSGEKKRLGVAERSGANSGMVEYPMRMGRPEEFAEFVLGCIRNGMVNGSVYRLDGAVRMPSRL
ncbi:hydroxyacyl-Coenzyme A dehydrogenase type II [Histoplasma capsulatum G186AR]|uniref:Hydroxyacyl-Coenzyme A dehydrogenase type II n=1 Tax=Ajellomyces capsulatus TaxID=5037 RepID=A0A8H8D3U3_AJECA|nr:hydroxyacyl-Coenzyme A dehydrogenase type II [Histoplasma capsulatum]QSS73189.1 hydroxyacyl-Coenzyme A dehydrogenase type II [Histoplasma capsulatum G186AR]